jgi:Fe-S cluster assembly protein SufD
MRPLEEYTSAMLAVNGKMPEPLHVMRADALASFRSQGFPGPKEEAWRFTDVSDVAEMDWQTIAQPLAVTNDVMPPRAQFWQSTPWYVTVVDGRIQANTVPRQTGVQIISLQEALQKDADQVLRHLGAYAGYEGHPFTALNTALFTDGVFLHLAAEKNLAQPIQIFYIQTQSRPTVLHPRSLFLFDRASQATVIETFVGLEHANYFINPVSEWVVGENAAIQYCKIQDEAADGYHINRHCVHQQADSRFQASSYSFGARLERNDLHAIIAGHNVDVELNGLYMIAGEQHVDHHTAMLHRQPHSFSRQLYKGILSGNSRAVFNGRIHVSREAQKTDAIQANKNLLLSDLATIDTQPQLEIFADDVRCTHGGTVGQLDEEGLFYLQSRGLSQESARNLMVHAFAGEVVQRVHDANLRQRLEQRVKNYLGWDEQ